MLAEQLETKPSYQNLQWETAVQYGDTWIDQRTDFLGNRNKLLTFYTENGLTSETQQEAIQYCVDQVRSVLGEWGFPEPFTFQQLYQARISRTETGDIRVIHTPRFGNWSERFLTFDGLGDYPNRGLQKAYEALLDASDGHVVTSFSSHWFYRSLGSPGDVLMAFRRLGQSEEGEVIVEGRYIFLKKLDPVERMVLYDCLGQPITLEETRPEFMILNPVTIDLTDYQKRKSDPVRTFGETLDYVYSALVGKPVLQGIQGELEASVMAVVNRYIQRLHNLLVAPESGLPLDWFRKEYIKVFRAMFLGCQACYTRYHGLSYQETEEHFYRIMTGALQLQGFGGIEGIGLNDSSDPWNPFTNNSEGYAVCKVCLRRLNEYNRCPVCKG